MEIRRIAGTSLLEFPIDNALPVWFLKSLMIRLDTPKVRKEAR
jgi:hypothetical protein